MKRQILLMAVLLCIAGQRVWGDNVTYLKRSWNSETKTVTTTTETANATSLHNVAKSGTWMGLGNGWYYMTGDRINIQTLNILGEDVHLILGDGTILECYGGIKLEEGHKLTIYGQSEGEGAGYLWAHQGTDTYKGYKNAAGIGGGEAAFIGTLEVHGGRIKADGGAYGAGIGHGAFDSKSKTKYTGKIIVYGGTINATGGESGAGIGSGSGHYDDANDSPEYIQYGGTVTCQGGENAAGLGGGGGFYKIESNGKAKGGQLWKATINGGTLTATGVKNGAGIGAGSHANKGGELIINGGKVTATGGRNSAGIGGGYRSYSPTITINGGNVKVNGKDAGIGCGNHGIPPEFTMYGGTVYVEGGMASAGVGGGPNSYGGKISIFGGSLEAVGKEPPSRAFGSGLSKDNKDYQDTESGSEQIRNLLYLGDETHFVKVKVGNSRTELGTQYSLAANRKNDCRTHIHAKVETCYHTDAGALSYIYIDESNHKKNCKYCGLSANEAHSYTEGKCVCGKEASAPATWTITVKEAASSTSDGYGVGVVNKVVKGKKFTLPVPRDIEKYEFMGWQVGGTAPDKYIIGSGETLKGPGEEVEVTANMTIYARYGYLFSGEEWQWADNHTSCTLTVKVLEPEATYTPDVTVTPSTPTTSEGVTETVYTANATLTLNGYDYKFKDQQAVYQYESLTLEDDNADNDSKLMEYDGYSIGTVTLKDRIFKKDNTWQTLCLPFSLTSISGTPLADADIRTLESTTFADGKLTLTFSAKQTSIKAGVPYIIKWTSGTGITSPAFSNVTIDYSLESVDTDEIGFMGTYSKITLEGGDNEVLFMGTDNKLYWPTSDVTLNANRCAFVLDGLTAADVAAARSIELDFGDGNTTSISEVTNGTPETGSVWFTISGHKLQGVPTSKGIYIHNGKKYIKK